MSTPKTDTEKQARRHRPALVGIAAAVGFAAVALVVFLFMVMDPDEGTSDGGTAATETGS